MEIEKKKLFVAIETKFSLRTPLKKMNTYMHIEGIVIYLIFSIKSK
jgi:hypothetical protein